MGVVFWLIAIVLVSLGAYAIVNVYKSQKKFFENDDGKGWR